MVNLTWVLYFYSNKLIGLGHNQKKWVLINQHSKCHTYETAELILSNELFLLIRLSNLPSSKIIILFIDQLDNSNLLWLNRHLINE